MKIVLMWRLIKMNELKRCEWCGKRIAYIKSVVEMEKKNKGDKK